MLEAYGLAFLVCLTPLFIPGFQASLEVNSTTNSQIRDLFRGGHLVRRQLHAGIRFIPTLSILIELQGWRFQIRNSRLFHSRLPDSKSVSWRLLGSTPATRRYKESPQAVNTHGATGLAISNTQSQITLYPLLLQSSLILAILVVSNR